MFNSLDLETLDLRFELCTVSVLPETFKKASIPFNRVLRGARFDVWNDCPGYYLNELELSRNHYMNSF